MPLIDKRLNILKDINFLFDRTKWLLFVICKCTIMKFITTNSLNSKCGFVCLKHLLHPGAQVKDQNKNGHRQ